MTMIKIIKVLKKSFLNEDLVENQDYVFDQDENLFTFCDNNHKIKFKGSIRKTYRNDELVIYLTDDMGGVMTFSLI